MTAHPTHRPTLVFPGEVAVRQVVSEAGRCSYVLACARTRAAALVDPHPDNAEALREVVAHLGLRPRYVLETRAPGREPRATTPAGVGRRYAALLADLGLEDADPPFDDGGAGRRATWWQDLPRLGPAGAAPPAPDSLVLQAGDIRVAVRCPAPTVGGSVWTMGGSHDPPLASRISGGARLALGAFHVAVLPLPERPGRVAFHAGHVVLTGSPLIAGAVDGAEGTAPCLLDLPVDTIVYPGLRSHGLTISTIAQEARWLQQLPASVDLRLHAARRS